MPAALFRIPAIDSRLVTAAVASLAFATSVAMARGGPVGAPVSMPAAVNSNAATDGTSADVLPSLATDGQGRWVCAWHSNDTLGGTVGADNDIFVSRSADDGQTWSTVKALNSNASTDGNSNDRNVRVATDGQGTWIAAWHSNDSLGGTTGLLNDIMFSRSFDNGDTWSPLAVLNSSAFTDDGNDFDVSLLWLGDHTWLAVWRTNDTLTGTIGNDGDIVFARSTNDGATWTPIAPLNTNATEDDGLDNTPRVALGPGAGGEIVCVWYSTENLGGVIGVDNDILFSRSINGGVTWSDPGVLNSNAAVNHENVEPQVTVDSAGTWVTAWASNDDFDGTIGNDYDILASHSTDGGQTWSPAAVLNTNAASDTGDDRNPWLAADAQNHWVCAWHSDDTLGGTIGTDTDILAAASDDGGLTWDAPGALNVNAGTDSGSDEFAVLVCDGSDPSGGAWMVVWESRDTLGGTIGTDRDILFARFARPDCNANTLPDIRETDCNDNNVPDDCDIDLGTSEDDNDNGIPDECDDPGPACPADIVQSGAVDIDDLLVIINSWGATGPNLADIAPPGGNGVVDIDDLLMVINGWGPCP